MCVSLVKNNKLWWLVPWIEIDLLTPKALKGLFWIFGVFGHIPLVSILFQFF